MIVRIILPWQFGEYPVYDEEGLQIGTEQKGGAVLLPVDSVASFAVLSYAPPPLTCPYVLAELSADQALIDTLAARPDCLLLCYVTEEGFTPNPIAPTARVAITKKIKDMDFPNLGLINAAIQASQNTALLAVKLAEKAFYRNVEQEYMTEAEILGGMLDRSPNL